MEALSNVLKSVGLGDRKNAVSMPSVSSESVVKAVNTAGVNAASVVKQSGELVEKFQELVEKVDSAAKALDDKAPQIANVLAKNSGPVQEAVRANAAALTPMMGGTNVALIGGMPKSLIVPAATRIIKQVAHKLRNFSNSARKAVSSLKGGFRLVGGVMNNAKKNIRNTVKVVPKMVGGMNMVAMKNGMPSFKMPSLSPVQKAAENALNAVSEAAKKAGNTTKKVGENVWRKLSGSGRSSKTRKSRKNRKNNKNNKRR
jgi:hypothetical protein